MRVERVTPAGLAMQELQCHQGVGFARMLDCFHYDTYPLEEALARWKAKPQPEKADPAHTVTSLIDKRYTDLFGMRRLQIDGSCTLSRGQGFSILIVVSGAGNIASPSERIPISQGDFLFIPAGVTPLCITRTDAPLVLVECLPPHL